MRQYSTHQTSSCKSVELLLHLKPGEQKMSNLWGVTQACLHVKTMCTYL